MIPDQEIKGFLDSLGTLGNLRIGMMPASPNSIGVINTYGGLASERRFGVVGVGYEKPSIQIMFRGEPEDYASPMAKARIAYLALAGIEPGTIMIGSAEYLTVNPQQPPYSLGKDNSLRYEIVFNIYITKEP